MSKTVRLKLEHSETAVLHCASRIYASLIALDPTQDSDALEDKCLQIAINLAQKAEVAIRSDGEVS